MEVNGQALSVRYERDRSADYVHNGRFSSTYRCCCGRALSGEFLDGHVKSFDVSGEASAEGCNLVGREGVDSGDQEQDGGKNGGEIHCGDLICEDRIQGSIRN